MKKVLWIKVSNDKYELIEAMGDTAYDLAKACGVTMNAVCSAVSHAKGRHNNSVYKRIVYDEEDNMKLKDLINLIGDEEFKVSVWKGFDFKESVTVDQESSRKYYDLSVRGIYTDCVDNKLTIALDTD